MPGVKPPHLIWLPEAIRDVERLSEFLRNKNPLAAAKAAKTILDGADRLVLNPHLGRPMPDGTERRELFAPFGAGAYVLRYRLNNQGIPVIIRVWHSLENRT